LKVDKKTCHRRYTELDAAFLLQTNSLSSMNGNCAQTNYVCCAKINLLRQSLNKNLEIKVNKRTMVGIFYTTSRSLTGSGAIFKTLIVTAAERQLSKVQS
jgi:hypothetical protein